MRGVACAVLAVLAGCAGEGTLVVAVRTDLVPQREFATVTVAIAPHDGSPERRFALPAGGARDWGAGARVAETTLPPGRYAARVQALDADGATVVERPIRVEIGGSGVRTVTVWLTRDCLGVECPLVGDAPSRVACLAGRCVEDGCAEESPEACGPAACASRDDCGPAPAGACATRECTPSGACVDVLDHAVCGADEVCEPAAGCAPPVLPPLSAPGAGHVHVVATTPGYHLYRIELREGAPAEYLGPRLDAGFPPVGTEEDLSASLSRNGEWMSVTVRRDGCVGCVLVAPVRDLGAAELIRVSVGTVSGTAITDDGATVIYGGEAGSLRAARRGPEGWVEDVVPLTSASTLPDHRDPSITPDGARIVFECSEGDRDASGFCEVGLDGTGFRVRMTPDSARGGAPRIPRELPDGSLVFHAGFAGSVQLWRLPPASVTAEPAFPGGDNDYAFPCVLSDGRLVAQNSRELFVLGADGRPSLVLGVDLPPERSDLFLDACGL